MLNIKVSDSASKTLSNITIKMHALLVKLGRYVFIRTACNPTTSYLETVELNLTTQVKSCTESLTPRDLPNRSLLKQFPDSFHVFKTPNNFEAKKSQNLLQFLNLL